MTLISWSARRRMVYISAVITTISILVGTYLFINLYEPPTCFDGDRNQDEVGVDCGGSCQYLCQSQVSDPIILFSRSFEVVPGVYNSVAYVENPNFDSAVQNFDYTFKLFDGSNSVITERSGRSFLTPGGISPIFEGGIVTEGNVPTRTFFEFSSELNWTRAQGGIESPLVIKDRRLQQVDTRPRIDATLENTSVSDEKNIEVIVAVFNAFGNIIATSRTFVDDLPRRTRAPLVFTWPLPFAQELEACIIPVDVMLLLDASGSMNDDGVSPPQPLTDAKIAAKDFVSRLGENDRVGLTTFATKSKINQSMTSEHEATRVAVEDLSIDPVEEAGSTNIGDAIFDAISEFANLSRRTSIVGKGRVRKVAILLTDGKANAPEIPGGELHAEQAAKKAKDNEITIYTVGLGDGVNQNFLKNIAFTPEHYFQAATSQELGGIYQQISDAICERGPARIEITPRSVSELIPIR